MSVGSKEVIVPTREGYDRWAEVYDTDGNPLIAIEEPEASRMIGEVRELMVADIGTGTGRHALRMARDGARVVAVDFSLRMMARARAKPGAERVAFLCADCSALPLPDSAFDRVISGLVVEHITALDPYFRELARICRPAGFIVVTNLHPAMNLQGARARFIDPETGAKVYPAGRDHLISDFVMAAQRAGLAIDEMVERNMTRRSSGKRRVPSATSDGRHCWQCAFRGPHARRQMRPLAVEAQAFLSATMRRLQFAVQKSSVRRQ